MRRPLVVCLLLIACILLLMGSRRRPVDRPTPPPAPTFSQEIVRILQANCHTCHRDGGIAPFALTTYDEARPYAELIRLMTTSRRMPPWKAETGCGSFQNERRLSDNEIDMIERWVEAGAPEGDPNDLPEPISFDDRWMLGTPDLVLAPQHAFTPPADEEAYRCFTIPTGLSEDRYLKSFDVLPGDRRTVHHVIGFIDEIGLSLQLDALTPEPGYECFGGPGFIPSGAIGGWSPGATPTRLPDGIAVRLRAGAHIVLQVHYSPLFSTPVPDRTEIGLYFADEQITDELQQQLVFNPFFTIPAGQKDVQVTARTAKARPIRLVSVYPHMHLLGTRIRMDAILPGGPQECLIRIDEWEFDWQQNYVFAEPRLLPAGTEIRTTCTYDNSADNPHNPHHPPQNVSWGERSTDEMCLAGIAWTWAD